MSLHVFFSSRNFQCGSSKFECPSNKLTERRKHKGYLHHVWIVINTWIVFCLHLHLWSFKWQWRQPIENQFHSNSINCNVLSAQLSVCYIQSWMVFSWSGCAMIAQHSVKSTRYSDLHQSNTGHSKMLVSSCSFLHSVTGDFYRCSQLIIPLWDTIWKFDDCTSSALLFEDKIEKIRVYTSIPA